MVRRGNAVRAASGGVANSEVCASPRPDQTNHQKSRHETRRVRAYFWYLRGRANPRPRELLQEGAQIRCGLIRRLNRVACRTLFFFIAFARKELLFIVKTLPHFVYESRDFSGYRHGTVVQQAWSVCSLLSLSPLFGFRVPDVVNNCWQRHTCFEGRGVHTLIREATKQDSKTPTPTHTTHEPPSKPCTRNTHTRHKKSHLLRRPSLLGVLLEQLLHEVLRRAADVPPGLLLKGHLAATPRTAARHGSTLAQPRAEQPRGNADANPCFSTRPPQSRHIRKG